MDRPLKSSNGGNIPPTIQESMLESNRMTGPAGGQDHARGQAQESSLFSASQMLAGFTAGRSEREYAPNETIFLQGEPANAVFYIERGEVKLSVVSKSGKQAIVDILGENAFFGEGCLAGEPVRVATAVSLQRSKIIRLEKRGLLVLFQRTPSVAEAVSYTHPPSPRDPKTSRMPSSA